VAVQLLKELQQNQVCDQAGELYAGQLQAHTKNLLLKENPVPDQVEETSVDSIVVFYKINASWLITFLKNHILFLLLRYSNFGK